MIILTRKLTSVVLPRRRRHLHSGMGADLLLVSVVSFSLLISLGFTRASNNAPAESNNMQYKEYLYKTEQLCPDLQEAIVGKDIDTANLPYKSVFRFMDQLQSMTAPYSELPCILEANGPKRIVSTALIEAIHVDTRPWNYSGAQACEEHIKLRLPEPTFLKRSPVPKIICRIPKSKANSVATTSQPMYHPFIWELEKGKLGLSFSSFNMSHVQRHGNLTISGDHSVNQSGGHEGKTKNNDFWLEPDTTGNKFVQIVFTTRFGGLCTVRVQQYLLDEEKTLCEGAKQAKSFRLCGLYDCSEKEALLKTLGFWTHRERHEKLDILLQSEIPRWRREEPTYLEILVSTLRALIMPLLFLSVFYVTRRLRLKLASRNASRTGLDRHRNVLRQRQCYLRSLMRDGNNSSSAESADVLLPSLILNHVVYDIPVADYPNYDDLPPPPYESIVQPPSYLEATNTSKHNPAPSPPPPPPPTDTPPSNQSSQEPSTHPGGGDDDDDDGGAPEPFYSSTSDTPPTSLSPQPDVPHGREDNESGESAPDDAGVRLIPSPTPPPNSTSNLLT